MKILGTSYELGQRVVSNEEVLEKVVQNSKNFQGDLPQTLEQISFYFKHSGIETRRYLDEGQVPIDMLSNCIDRLLHKTDRTKDQIDLVIHCGIGRGFIEPGQAHVVAHACGLYYSQCFDVVDACNGWIQSLFVAYHFLKQRSYRNILIVNTECNMIPGGYFNPAAFTLNKPEDLDYCFPGMTFGDGVAATLVTQSDDEWRFQLRSRRDAADLCTTPIRNYQFFCRNSHRYGANGENFASFAKEMHRISGENPCTVLHQLGGSIERFQWIFTHGHAKNFWIEWFRKVFDGDPKVLKYNTYEKIGNLGAGSIPSSMAMAEEQGDLQRGDRIAFWMLSAGMSAAGVEFVY